MPYALRNTLILIVLLIFVFMGFQLINSSSVKKLNVIKTSYEDNKQQLDDLLAANPDMKDQEFFLASLKELEIKIQAESKIIPQTNDPTLTYKYLLDICDNFCPEVKFDFRFTKTGRVGNTGYRTYAIFGKAPARALYTFIRQIENQFMLYVIDSIKLIDDFKDDISTGMVDFTIIVNAYYEEETPEIGEGAFRKLKYKQLTYNPFYSRIHGKIPDEEQQKFLDTYKATLIGLSPDKIFLKDAEGRIHTLEIGDKVAYGYLHSINWDIQGAVFKLNEVGVTKEKIIYLYESDKE